MPTRKTETTPQTTIRLDDSVLSRADDLVEFLSGETGQSADRVKVLRSAIMIGLRELERRKTKAEAGGA